MQVSIEDKLKKLQDIKYKVSSSESVEQLKAVLHQLIDIAIQENENNYFLSRLQTAESRNKKSSEASV